MPYGPAEVRVRRIVLGALLVFGLGCAGVGEKLLEVTTGGEIQITEDGMVMKMEDGSTVTVVSGPEVEVPEGFPLPSPSEGAVAQSLTTLTSPDGETSVMVSYTMEQTKEVVLERYRAWFEEQGIETEHESQDAVGTHSEILKGQLPDGREAAILTSEAFGQSTVTLMVGERIDELRKQ